MTALIISYITDGYISFTNMDEKSKYLTITEFIKLKTLNPRKKKHISHVDSRKFKRRINSGKSLKRIVHKRKKCLNSTKMSITMKKQVEKMMN